MSIKGNVRAGRLQLAERVLKELIEGRRTGGDFGATERMTARFINKMEKDGASPEQIDKAEQQADRIRNRMTAKHNKLSRKQAMQGPLKVKAPRIRIPARDRQGHLLTRLKRTSANPDDPSKPSTSDIRAAAGKARYRNKG